MQKNISQIWFELYSTALSLYSYIIAIIWTPFELLSELEEHLCFVTLESFAFLKSKY